jgi:predicted O-methyltransferase YrrM
MLRRLLSRTARAEPPPAPAQNTGQLDNPELEALVRGIVERGRRDAERVRLVVEVGTGGGEGSTVAIHRALTASNCRFELLGYEGDADLAARAAQHWSDVQGVRVLNEYFMRREDIDRAVKPHIAPADRESYVPEFEAIATKENFLATTPPAPIDLLLIDSVRYTHLGILRAATPWLRPETVVVMEDDIPGYGELAIVETEFELRNVVRHELAAHPWPVVEFSLAI